MLIGATIGTFIVALTLVYIYYKYVLFNFWRKRGIFYVEPVIPTGNVTDLVIGKMTIGELFQNAYMKYKDRRIFGMYIFFKPNLVIADLDLIRIVLTKKFGSFHDRGMFCNEKTDPLSGHLFLLPGKKWRNLRVKLTPTFTSGKIKQMFVVLKECGEEFVKSLESKVHTENVIEIKDMLARYSTDIIMSTAFGIKSNCLVEPNNEFRRWGKKIFEVKAFWNALMVFVPQIMDLFSLPSTDRGVSKFFTKLFQDNVEYRQTHNIVRHDFMNLLIQLMEKGYVEPDDDKDIADQSSANMNKLTMLEAAAQAFVFFLAGFETSSTTATYSLYELALNQNIQDKVRREIDETLKKHGELTYEAVNEMTYLHKVVQETLRKYPPVPILNRICTKEILLPTTNIQIPEGTQITIPVLGVQRDPSIYPDPEKFDPERFNVDQVATRHPYAYLPFGEGPRVCIGTRFGYVQTKVGIISLLSKFKFKLHSQTPVPLVFNESAIVLTPKSGVHLIIESR
ncbi:PREDICTED: probable cytochrome P450 6a14 [Dinoponera quadriceps]|uniref:Probable cytochrome P450 6a14 n=1 Tax=Dinoponera quadriceps TaxID=609295 RepID=A0A6P3YE22_DINQU|nr:PREDICTED: probable cytochrome P450 6a14 [Dinoponera quadriceps]XP_014488134.1 PREDICTED: probable cytochrome P450 6a14 [Dinoponera quadriceps]